MSDFFVKQNDTFKRVIYLVKEFLKEREEINIVCHFRAAFIATRVVNSLETMGYTETKEIKTLTQIYEGRRSIKFSSKLVKTKEFDKLYADNEERVKKLKEQSEKENTEKR